MIGWATHLVSNYIEYTMEWSQPKHEYFDFSQTHSMISKIIIPKHIMNHLIHIKSYLKIIRKHIHIIDQTTMSHTHITYSHIQSCERIPTSNCCWWGINTYSHIQSYEWIYTYIWSILKTLILSHISQKAKFIQHIIIFSTLTIIPTIKEYQLS